jgi:hypothetical protein
VILNLSLYTKNLLQLANAISESGGDPYVVLIDYQALLSTLASNNIVIKATYEKPN